MINIITGSAHDEPASYTRFVFPFAYQLGAVEKIECPVDKFCWIKETDSENELWKKSRNYFTKETAEVLYEKAQRYVLKRKDEFFEIPYLKLDFALKFWESERKINTLISVRPPRLVLFEFTNDNLKNKTTSLKTGFLILEIYFRGETELDTMLAINELLRYRRRPFDQHKNPVASIFCKKILEKLNTLGNCNKNEHYGFWQSFIEQKLKCKHNDYCSLIGESERSSDIYADDRAFTWTCAVIKDGGNALANNLNFHPDPAEKKWQAHRYGHWIKLLNVDKPAPNFNKTHLSTEFERDWAEKRTYHRWEESGIFYGFNYHSGALLCSDLDEPPIWKHFATMYFDMVLLLLYVRVTLFRFSGELTTNSLERDADKFEKIRGEFSLFTNRYQFPLISNQQQGVELYAIAREFFDIQNLFEEVQSEIHNSHDFIQQKLAREQSNRTLDLTWIATVGLAISIVLAFIDTELGKREFEKIILRLLPLSFEGGWFSREWGAIAILVIISGALLLTTVKVRRFIIKIWRLFKEIIQKQSRRLLKESEKKSEKK